MALSSEKVYVAAFKAECFLRN
ncbi:protein of unknown function [Magnetospirillum sp. XM-1]|nr:protein of unknown function [Magnetospirillum sp. XM-1]